jgi:predicted transcriptional regulator
VKIFTPAQKNMSTQLDLASFTRLTEVISTLLDLIRQLIATKAEDQAAIADLSAKLMAEVESVAALSADNEAANTKIPELVAQVEAAIAEASAAIPAPAPTEPTEPTV